MACSPHGPSAPRPKPPAKPFDAREADALYLRGFAVEHGHAGVGEDLADFLRLAPFVVMVSEHGDHRNFHRRGQLARQDPRLIRKAVVGEVAAQHQHVGGVADLAEQWLKRTLRVFET